MTRQKITFVTGNKQKLDEFKKCLGEDVEKHFDISSKDVDLPEYQGEPAEVARKKCLEAARQVHGAVICEDTSLCFRALNGLPGPYVKWFVEKIKPAGLVTLLAGHADKSAFVLSVFAYCGEDGQKVELFEGRKDGRIVAVRGQEGDGFEAIFQPEGEELTYAEMSKDKKTDISERSQSLHKLQQFLMDSVK
ncbi:inosine triphosphate pyrophosphatase-like [Paramacrobiotus metropolitanus]|uniref:inosine triphosphate pyrophosphatase-like n=1 Tax=Paramacrobiotus metropolitanus TaxID=2943436 RepID=UPI0024460678|nr:inosine triphosphate pyrophosphatase-like [Paramacrobiotus metropolitanus]XP_055343588.1 inosine triphosphate pyrophosphatase-like [Paramacrobiotus metropolitanus]